jgi:hypothetical protein
MFNLAGKIGGNSDLSPQGKTFAEKLPDAISKLHQSSRMVIWTSTLKRCACQLFNNQGQSKQHYIYHTKSYTGNS